MTEMRLHSSSDEELDLESFVLLLGVPIVKMGGLYVIFVISIISALYND